MTELVIKDLLHVYSSKTPRRRDTLLMRLVRGGDVATVGRVLVHMQSHTCTHLLDWTMGKPCKMAAKASRGVIGGCHYVWRVFVVVFIVLVTLVCSLFFQILHGAAVSWHASRRQPIHIQPDLPLAIAAFSEDPDMIALMLTNGASLDQQDTKGNTVFHYLADLSFDDPQKAIRCFEAIKIAAPGVHMYRNVVLSQDNLEHFTPLEMAINTGSMKWFNYLVNQEGIIRCTVVDVQSGGSTVAQGDKPPIHTDNTHTHTPAYYKLCRFELTPYENGDTLGNQSLLLQLAVSRNIINMSEE